MAWSDAARAAAALARKARGKIEKYVIKTQTGFMTRVPGYSVNPGFTSRRAAFQNVRSAIKEKRKYRRLKKQGKNPPTPEFQSGAISPYEPATLEKERKARLKKFADRASGGRYK